MGARLAESIVSNAPFLDTPPPLPYATCAYLAYNEAKAFELEPEEYSIKVIGKGKFASGPIVIVATNRATYRELPVVNGKPVVRSMREATFYDSERDALAALASIEPTYGELFAFELQSARCVTGEMEDYGTALAMPYLNRK